MAIYLPADLSVNCFRLEPKYAIMPSQTATPRLYKLPYHRHLQESGLDYCESYGGISVIQLRTRTTSAVSPKIPR